MYLTGLIHRDRLFDIASRWLADRLQPEDGRLATEVFVFERIVTAPTVRGFVADLGRCLDAGPLTLERVQTKDAVRRAIAEAVRSPSSRVCELIDRYWQLPEEYFPRTPVSMSLISCDDGRLFAMVRRKGIRRIADKVSRRVSEQLGGVIQEVARGLSRRRAESAGVELDALVSTRTVMEEEFATAERIVADRIRRREITLAQEGQRVDDVIGVKLIGESAELARVEELLAMRAGSVIRHREVHDGSYCGTHLLVDLELPAIEVIVDRMQDSDWRFAAERGLDPSKLPAAFANYVASGSRSFRTELILTTFEDLVESEFGDSIHEARILEQRSRMPYTGRIAQNASYIIEYLLRFAISPTVSIDELPIKVWGRYLRDTVAQAIARLWVSSPPEWLTDDREGTRPVMEDEARVIPSPGSPVLP